MKTADNKMLELKSGDPMLARLDLAYALNMHMAQGITADKAITAMHSSEKHLSSKRLFNVTVSRVRDNLTLYTDDKDKLARQIERTPGDKSSSLETLGKIRIDPAKNSHAGKTPAQQSSKPAQKHMTANSLRFQLVDATL